MSPAQFFATAGPADYFAILVSYLGNPLSMFLAIQRKPFGWWIVGATQALFVAFALSSGDWRFGGQILCLAMGIYGIWMWQIKGTHRSALDVPSPHQSEIATDVLFAKLSLTSNDIESAATAAYGKWAWERLRVSDPGAIDRWILATRAAVEHLGAMESSKPAPIEQEV